MPRNAMVATVVRTAHSMIKMNHAARFAVFAEGWVMPMVLMKAFEMKRRSFTLIRGRYWWNGSRILRQTAESE
jgi:hypothetical protein